MFKNLTVFRLAHAMATHAGQRQAVIARNVANADTPGYRARDVPAFADIVARTDTQPGLRSSRAGHFGTQDQPALYWSEVAPQSEADPNGNSVSVEQEMLRAVDAKRQHDRALAIYRSALGVLRTSLGRG